MKFILFAALMSLVVLLSCSTEQPRPAYYTRSDSSVGRFLEEQYGIDSTQYVVRNVTRCNLDFDSTCTAIVILDSIREIENRLRDTSSISARDSNQILNLNQPTDESRLNLMKSMYDFSKLRYNQRNYYSVESDISGSAEPWILLVDTADFSVRYIRLPQSSCYKSTD